MLLNLNYLLILRRSIFALLCSLCICLVACSTSFAPEKPTLVRLQSASLAPGKGGNWLQAQDLQAGDILLSANHGLNSQLIRLGSFSSVSHAAIYIGEGQVAEAVGSHGVSLRSIAQFIQEEDTIVALRHPAMTAQAADLMSAYAQQLVGRKYNTGGIILQTPFMVQRKVCELPLTPGLLRDFCLSASALVFMGASSQDKFFCSQFVVDAFAKAGLALTYADPRWVSPSDLLHMREQDVPAFTPKQKLEYLGHMKLAVRDAPDLGTTQ